MSRDLAKFYGVDAVAMRIGDARTEPVMGLDLCANLLFDPDGTVRFMHKCDRAATGRGVIVCAPRLMIGQGHTVTREPSGRATVRASILCDDCGTHGFVTDGHWEAA